MKEVFSEGKFSLEVVNIHFDMSEREADVLSEVKDADRHKNEMIIFSIWLIYVNEC